MPTFHQVVLDDAARSRGVVVVIDVLRAFTLSALALHAGAREIRCVRSVEDAFAERAAAPPGTLIMGEAGTRAVEGFDLENSPTQLLELDVRDRVLVHRSSAGTQGIVAAAPVAEHLFAASFVCAGATAAALRALDPDEVTFVLTGADHRDGDEDRACADYVTALVLAGGDGGDVGERARHVDRRRGRVPADGGAVDPAPYLERVRRSDTGRMFLDPARPDLPLSDVEHAVRVDAVPFALRVDVDRGHDPVRAVIRRP